MRKSKKNNCVCNADDDDDDDDTMHTLQYRMVLYVVALLVLVE